MTQRKIEAMHHYYGTGVGCCAECPHLIEHVLQRKWYKCRVYGESKAESTDWRKSYPACGLIDKPFPYNETRIVTRIVAKKEQEQSSDGQITFLTEDI